MADKPSMSESILLTQMATEIVSAYVQNNVMKPPEVIEFIFEVCRTLSKTLYDGRPIEGGGPLVPAIAINKSVNNDYIVCLEDGRRFKYLRRHLRTTYGLSPDQYRIKWGLPPDYPMVAPNYTAKRAKIAKDMGLGRAGNPPKSKKKSSK